MTNREWIGLHKEKLAVFSGILFHNQVFSEGKQDVSIQYDFSCPEFRELREKYGLDTIAGSGSDYVRAKRLLHFLAPRLSHSSWYDNHVPCNALALLDYSLDKKECGINCLNKSKILAECCMAVGIYARRVRIMPYSPYDLDNHVVTEIYDRHRKKWIMLDPTTDGYFIDGDKTPLSLLELRDRFANDKFATFVSSASRPRDLGKYRDKYIYHNAYICKNLFYFSIEQENRFGAGEHFLILCPEHYAIREKEIANARYRIDHMPEEYRNAVELWKKKLEILEKTPEPEIISARVMTAAPV